MKKANIIILVLIAATIGIIVSSMGDMSTYETFQSAIDKPEKNTKVIGFLDTTKAMEYDPLVDANKFVFYAKDKDENLQRVTFNGTKPQDFERSEQLVMTGKMTPEGFVCYEIQMKCPSKYENDQIVIAEDAKDA